MWHDLLSVKLRLGSQIVDAERQCNHGRLRADLRRVYSEFVSPPDTLRMVQARVLARMDFLKRDTRCTAAKAGHWQLAQVRQLKTIFDHFVLEVGQYNGAQPIIRQRPV
jgi:hypothetical protein